jgi:hypothetical protein
MPAQVLLLDQVSLEEALGEQQQVDALGFSLAREPLDECQ